MKTESGKKTTFKSVVFFVASVRDICYIKVMEGSDFMKSVSMKKRLIFLATFVSLFIVEVLIALYFHDDFIRPFVGDMIVTVLVWSFARVIFPDKFKLMSVYVMIFATLIEVGQYFNYVELLGVQDNPLLVTVMGTSFAWADIACYAVGCTVAAVIDFLLFRKKM